MFNFSILNVCRRGLLQEGTNRFPTHLQAVHLPILPDQTCQQSYGNAFFPNFKFCAGFLAGGRDACQGGFDLNELLDNSKTGVNEKSLGSFRWQWRSIHDGRTGVGCYFMGQGMRKTQFTRNLYQRCILPQLDQPKYGVEFHHSQDRKAERGQDDEPNDAD